MSTPGVQIKYDGKIFGNSITGNFKLPCPLVDINTNANRDSTTNQLLNYTNEITLDGTIIGSGSIDGILPVYSGVQQFFQDPIKQNSVLDIVCGNYDDNGVFTETGTLISYSGVYYRSSTTSKNENNWVITIPYTVTLENVTADPGEEPIESYDDSWTIEPVQEISFFSNLAGLNTYNLRSNYTTSNNPPVAQDSSIAAASSTNSSNIQNFLQYRITHRVSAVGKPQSLKDPNNPSVGGSAQTDNQEIEAFETAARWVQKRLSQSVRIASSDTTNPSGLALLTKADQANLPPVNAIPTDNFRGLFLYNHLRTIDSSPSAGSYGITDTWLAMGTGVKYTEEFTWEVSTDSKWIKTVNINGTINGLEYVGPSGYGSVPIAVATGLMRGVDNSNPDAFFRTSEKIQSVTNNKYAHALEAYTSGIKPVLYQRASHAMSNSSQIPPGAVRNNKYVSPPSHPLNIVPLSLSETFNPTAGVISYNISYDTRPACLLSGALAASFNINDTKSVAQVAETFVLGRPAGPIVEKIGNTKPERQLSIDVLYPAPRNFTEMHPNSPSCVVSSGHQYRRHLETLIRSFAPIDTATFSSLLGLATSAYPIYKNGPTAVITNDSETWDPFEGRFTKNITWSFSEQRGCA
jgi:hypothetical protein